MRRKGNEMTKLEQAIMDWVGAREAGGEPEFYGFLVARGVRDMTSSKLLPGHGTLYNALYRLERDGRLTSRWEPAEIAEREKRPRRRLYRTASRPPTGRSGDAEG
jgi:hypothetical protein